MRLFSIAVVIFLIGVVPAHAQLESWSTLRDQIGQSLLQSDVEQLDLLGQQLQDWKVEQTEWKHYWQAYISYRLINRERDEQKRTRHMRACKEQAEAAIAAGEHSGESHAILAACLGRLAAGGMTAGMRYGTYSGNMQDESILTAPDNPRVLLLAAVSDYNKPVMWGGDIDRAERRLRRAVELLQDSGPNETEAWMPQWGLIDGYGHLAIVLNRLEQKDDALAVLDQAKTNGTESPWLERVREYIQNPD